MRVPMLEGTTRALSLSPALQKHLGSGLSSGLSDGSLSSKTDLPGGSPFSLCEVSRSTDLFDITSVELTNQPVYIDSGFIIHIYGAFQQSLGPNTTLSLTANCGSHCEEYGTPPEDWSGETGTVDLCEMSMIEQPLGGRERNETCPPEEGYALISLPGYVVPEFLNVPGWYNFTIDAKTAEGDRIYCLTTEVCLRWEDEEKNKQYPPGRWNKCSWPR